MGALIFDTELTDKENGEIIEAAWLRLSCNPQQFFVAVQWSQRYCPSKPSTCGALAVHHILHHELEGLDPSCCFEFPADADYIIGHSVDIDWIAAGAPSHIKRIDTHPISQWVWPDATGYSQTALLYMLFGVTESVRDIAQGAHGALNDCRINGMLLREILKTKPEIKSWEELWLFSEECRIPRTCPLGRWRGVLLEDMDFGAINWCLGQPWIDPYFRKGLNRALEKKGHTQNFVHYEDDDEDEHAYTRDE